MKYLIFTLMIISSAANASTKLLMIGGGTRPPEAMAAFVKAAGGETANILICSWASESIEGASNVQTELSESHPASIQIMPTFPMKGNDEIKLLAMIKSASGIFFTGGDQSKLMLAIKTEKLKEVFKEAYTNGVAFAGTSAGTAVMSERMITGDAAAPADLPPFAEGLGLLPSEIIVDQHFIVRNRFNRLANLVMNLPDTYGVGIDEGTAIMVINNRMARVIGPSPVLTFARENERKLSVEHFKNNEMFNLFGLKD